jgi:hypothetical protein
MLLSKGLQVYLVSFVHAQWKIDHREKMKPVLCELIRKTRNIAYGLESYNWEKAESQFRKCYSLWANWNAKVSNLNQCGLKGEWVVGTYRNNLELWEVHTDHCSFVCPICLSVHRPVMTPSSVVYM